MESFGRYQLLSKLATGGMAQVFLARQTGPDGERLVVLKRILPHLAENEEFVRMFLQEARVAARLHHPGIAQVFDLGKVSDSFFLAMEYVHGEDFRRIVRQASADGRPLPVPLACRMVAGAAAGLHAAHEALDEKGQPLNVVHRDVSPQNLLVTFEGQVKVIDFGIAKAADSANTTRTGVLKGKYSYMSPEQADGRRVDRRSDVFALGIVLYELVTQQRLFRRATDLATIQAVLACKVQPPSNINPAIDPDLDALLLRVLTKDRDKRTPTAGALADELETYLEKHQLPGTTKHLRQYMRELYTDRLSREAELGHPEYPDELAPTPTNGRLGPSGSSFEFGRPPPKAAPPIVDVAPEDVNLEPSNVRPPPPVIAPKVPTSTETERLSNANEVVARATDGVKLAPMPRRSPALAGPPPLSPAIERGEVSEFSRVARTGIRTRFLRLVAGAAVVALATAGAWFVSQGGPRGTSASTLRIKSDPPGAAVFLDDDATGQQTPATLAVDAARPHLVRLELDGYAPVEEAVEPFEGTAVRDLRLRRRDVGALKIETDPPGASIVLDGSATGHVTPALVTDLDPNVEHEVLLSLPGYIDEQVQAQVAAGKTRPLARTLRKVEPAKNPGSTGASGGPGPAPDPKGSATTATTATTPVTNGATGTAATTNPAPDAAGLLQVTSTPAGLDVEVDGTPAGKTPIAGMKLAPGRHDVRFVDPSRFLDQSQSVTIAAGETAKVERAFVARKVRLNVTPYAKVYIRDREFAESPSDAELVPGTYRLTFSCPDLRAKRTETVTIPPGAEPFKISFALKEGEGYD